MFKGTGIIRRIDNIGRLVIPREVRKKYNIKDGDPIEIGYNQDSIELKKYSLLAELGDKACQLSYIFAKISGLPIILCNKDKVITSAKVHGCIGREISAELSDCMDKQRGYNPSMTIFKNEDLKAAAIEWIEVSGEIIGALIIPKNEDGVKGSDLQCLKMCAQAISLFAS